MIKNLICCSAGQGGNGRFDSAVSVLQTSDQTERKRGRMSWISALSTQRLNAAIILPWWDFLSELYNSNASTQMGTRLFCCFISSPPPPPLAAASLSSVQHFALSSAAGKHLPTGRTDSSCHGNTLTHSSRKHEVQEVHHHHAGSIGGRPPQQERTDAPTSQTLEAGKVSVCV